MNQSPHKSTRQMFTPEEDDKLRKIIMNMKSNNLPLNWNMISEQIGSKNQRQCRDRWIYYLNEKVNHTPFTPYENYMILWLISKFGKKWTQITQLFHNKTDVSIKSQYKKLIRRNATLENVFTISNAKYYKQPKNHPVISKNLQQDFLKEANFSEQVEQESEFLFG